MDLYYAQYKLKSTPIPPYLALSKDVETCLQTNIPQIQNFDQELEIVAKYNDIVEAEATTSSSATKTSCQLPSPATTALGQHASNDNKPQARDSMANEMANRTGLSINECNFYLESMGWDLNTAMEMWKGLSNSS